MSALLSDFEHTLLAVVWMASAGFAALSTFMLLTLALRRAFRDRMRRQEKAKMAQFDALLSALVRQRIAPRGDMLPHIDAGDVAALVNVLLNYLRNLSGADADLVIDAIDLWDIESLLVQEAKHGHRGRRIEALAVLSYLRSETSLASLVKALRSEDDYVQLAAIRCIARRGAIEYLPHIIDAINQERERNRTILAEVLQRFGAASAPYLEKLTDEAASDSVLIAALEALAMIAPEHVQVNMKALMAHSAPRVRAAAVRLAGVSAVSSPIDVIALGLEDQEALVRIRAAVAAGNAGRQDLLPALRRTLADPVWWVRFRACQAMLNLGAAGRAVLRTVAAKSGDEAILAADILSEAERA